MSAKKTTPRRRAVDPDAPTSSPSKGTPTPSPRRTQSATAQAQAAAAPPRGPLPVSAETSYHKRLRSLLLEHKRCRKEWQELVIRGLVGRCRGTIDLWTDIEIGLAYVQKGLAGENKQKVAVRAGYVFAQSARLSEQVATINAVLVSLNGLLLAMAQICERAEDLVVEAANTRGNIFAFRDPLWVTWHLARFSDGLLDITSHHRASLALMHTLVEQLITFPPLPSETQDPYSLGDDAKTRPSNEEIQAAMSLLAVQPLLPGKNGEGTEAWEEIMAVEVGGWA